MTDADIVALAAELGRQLAARNARVTAAESCTGGLLAGAITAIAGSSGWFERGFVTYSNEAKVDMLGVDPLTLREHGAVSEATARQMAEGALKLSGADLSVAVTGVAGPGGGTASKPVGMVCFAWLARDGTARTATRYLSGDREAVRRASVSVALQGLIDSIDPAHQD
ncbi:MAG: nicotinamide-nucleotide amidohydrolase family protein [Betaproteobacteria bacterium]